jgi:hypothetical protein
MVVHQIPLPPPDNLSTFIELCVAFIYFVSTTTSFLIVGDNFYFWETELEALNDKIFPFFTRYHFSNFH